MDYEITVRVSAGEKVIEIPWEDIKEDYNTFVKAKADLGAYKSLQSALVIIESRVRNVFLDRYKKYLIQ